MKPLISVIIPTHNPNLNRLKRTLEGLRSQSLPYTDWQLVIIDNASTNREFLTECDLSWHPEAKTIYEGKLGLTRARIAGIQASQGEYIVFVDDDNVLNEDYLKYTLEIFQAYSQSGAIGGKSLPEFEVEPEPWMQEFYLCLALRDFGDEIKTYAYSDHNPKHHPEFAPIGAGMALCRKAAEYYCDRIQSDSNRQSFDRTGSSLQSGGDCDMNLTILEANWAVGYFPQLQLTHLISANRLTKEYLARLNYASTRSWVQVLDAHQIRPWQKIPRWSVFPRQLKALLSNQPWKDPAAYIRWRGACGLFEGQAELP